MFVPKIAEGTHHLTAVTALQSLGGSLVPTLGGLIRLPGASLGGAALTSNILALFDNGAAGVPLTVVNFTESALIVSIPPGDGANHTLQVRTLKNGTHTSVP